MPEESEPTESDWKDAQDKLRLALMYAAGKLADEIMNNQRKKRKENKTNG